MNAETTELFRTRMDDAALLSPGDPFRMALEDELALQRPDLLDEWLMRLEENERLRLELRQIAIPQVLKDRLFAYPKDEKGAGRLSSSYRSGLFALAAVVLLAIGYGLWRSADGIWESESVAPYQTIAAMAMDDHLNDRHLTVKSATALGLTQELGMVLPKRIQKALQGGSALLPLGGRNCRWGDCDVKYSLWQYRGRPASIIEFNPREFGMNQNDLKRHRFCCKELGFREASADAVIWHEGDRGYALVADPQELDRLSKELGLL